MKNRIQHLLAASLLLTTLQSSAQIRFPVTNNDLRTNLQKVVADFPKSFTTLKGEVRTDNPQTVEYTSLLQFDGAQDNVITQYKGARPIYSWQAMLLSTEEFDEAAKKYKWLCGQLKVMTVKLDNGYSFNLNGEYEAPDESRKFSSSVFKLTPNAVNMPKLKIEASMQFEFPEWKISLLVYEKEREDNERGKTEEDK